MTNDIFRFTIITPEGEFYSEEVEQVVFRSTEGDIGVLNDHIPTTIGLGSGPCVITKEGKEIEGVVHGGFAEVKGDQVILLPDAAEWPDEIDVDRAKRAKERAEQTLEATTHHENFVIIEAKASLARAMARLQVVESHQKE